VPVARCATPSGAGLASRKAKLVPAAGAWRRAASCSYRRGRRRGVPSRLQAGPRRHRFQAAYRALPVRIVSGLDQGQEPGQPGDAACARGDVVTPRSPASRGTDMRVCFRQLRTCHQPGPRRCGPLSAAELRCWRRQVLPRDRPPWRVAMASDSGHERRNRAHAPAAGRPRTADPAGRPGWLPARAKSSSREGTGCRNNDC
jgi:hypothetical protein